MEEIVSDSIERDRQYGLLGIRFNALRDFYECVRNAVNKGEAPYACEVE